MSVKTLIKEENKIPEVTVFYYDNTDLPRDFDIRIEVAEQREVLDNTYN